MDEIKIYIMLELSCFFYIACKNSSAVTYLETYKQKLSVNYFLFNLGYDSIFMMNLLIDL